MRNYIHARILELDNVESCTRVLCIEFADQSEIDYLFTPNLTNIGFVVIGNEVTVSLKNPVFREYFNDWVVLFLTKLEGVKKDESLVGVFNDEIKALVLLGQKEKKISVNSARGLFGELVLMKSYLDDGNYTHAEILEAWHRPIPAIQDFEFHDFLLEVKTISRSRNSIRISSEDQLVSGLDKILYLCVLKIEDITKSNSDSLGDLYVEIKSKLSRGLANLFEIKCAEDLFCPYLGPELMPLDYKFKIIEQNLYEVDQVKFPRIKKELLMQGLSRISYDIDLSVMNAFIITHE